MSVASLQRKRYERILEQRIRETFEEAARDMEEKLADFNRRHRIKEQIHLKDVAEGRWTQEQFDSWMRGQVFQGKQWNAKKEQMQKILANANSTAVKMVNDQKKNLFAFNANYQAYQLEHGAGVDFGFGIFDSYAVERLIRSEPQLLPMWKIDEPKDYVWNSTNVNNAIRQGIIQGERLDQIAKRLSDGLSAKNMNKMLTFARTGMTEAQNAGRQTRLKEAEGMGIKVHKEWMCTLDEHTRWQHADLDGQKRPVDKPFEIDGYKIRYPGDPTAHPSMVYNCRCTLVGDLDDFPEEYKRYDNIDGKPIKSMTYREWEKAKGKQFSKSKASVVKEFNQTGIGLCKTVQEVNDLLNSANLFRETALFGGKVIKSKADLTGCDLDSAKSIAAAYEQVFAKYPQLKGKFDAPNAQPIGMSDNTYAWCYLRNNGLVQVNPGPQRYGNWKEITRQYEEDVLSGWHPKGTTAESIVTHEIGHAIDGLLARERILGGVAADGSYRYASSTLKNTIMKRAAKLDPDIAEGLNIDKMLNDTWTTDTFVSRYASKNNQEWFAECFAEYITSANPRVVASEFGKELEKLISKLK